MVVMIHNPHKRFFCLFSYAGTPRRQLIEVEVSLNAFILSEYRPLGKIKSRERMQSLTNLIRHTKLLLFPVDFCAVPTEMVNTELPQS